MGLSLEISFDFLCFFYLKVIHNNLNQYKNDRVFLSDAFELLRMTMMIMCILVLMLLIAW